MFLLTIGLGIFLDKQFIPSTNTHKHNFITFKLENYGIQRV